jgi:protein phosphatase
MLIALADPCLVLLIGPSGSGKSTFARRHFRGTEVLSSDFCRALVCDDENNQAATGDAFELLHLILAKRLQRRRTTVIDATNVQVSARAPLIAAAKHWKAQVVAIVFALPEAVCQLRNQHRAYRQVPADVIQLQAAKLAESIGHLDSEGLYSIHLLRTLEEAEAVTVVRQADYS